MSSEHAQSILLVDDDATFRDRLARALRDRGLDVRVAGGFDDAIARAKEDSPELALVDLKMPGKSGLDLVRALKEIDASTKIIVLTGYGSIATAVEAMRLGAAHYLSKPADADEIVSAFARDASDSSIAAANDDAPSLARVEYEHIQRVLADCSGSISEAARRLRIHRRSLQRKLQKHPPKR